MAGRHCLGMPFPSVAAKSPKSLLPGTTLLMRPCFAGWRPRQCSCKPPVRLLTNQGGRMAPYPQFAVDSCTRSQVTAVGVSASSGGKERRKRGEGYAGTVGRGLLRMRRSLGSLLAWQSPAPPVSEQEKRSSVPFQDCLSLPSSPRSAWCRTLHNLRNQIRSGTAGNSVNLATKSAGRWLPQTP